MTDYSSIIPREDGNDSSSRLFAFERIRADVATRFCPGAGTTLHFANRDTDTLNIASVPKGFLVKGDTVKAYYKGICVFQGEVASRIIRRGRGSDSSMSVVVAGPWSKMQRLVYRQGWFTGSGYEYSSRLVLNEYRDGTPQNLNSELREIAGYGADKCGYSLSSVNVSTQILPFDECRDVTIADAIRRELRLFPRAVTRFDYSGDTPVLVIEKPNAALSAAYVADIPKQERNYTYNDHPITGVDLEIEAIGTINGVQYRQISHQKAGDTAAGNPDCLYATLQIKAASSNAVYQTFESITENIPSNLNSVDWWKEKHPRLANVGTSAITITGGKRSPSNYPRISANTAGQIEEAGLKCEVSKFTCNATIKTEDDEEENIVLTLFFLTTNANGTAEEPNTYTWLADSSAESGETVPEGLAATILAERSGSLQQESMTIRLGDTLPKLGDAIIEDEGTVFLQSFDIDCYDLTASLSFGVPEYLAPEDMAALLSNFRNKSTCSSSSMRKSGKIADRGSKVKMGGIMPISSSEFAPGNKALITVKSSSGSSAIRIDPSALDDDKTAEVKELQLNGTKKTNFIATDNVDIVQKTIVAGDGIQVSSDDNSNTVTISAIAGASEETFSGDIALGGPISYANHEITQRVQTLTVVNGVIVKVAESTNPPIVAVEETV